MISTAPAPYNVCICPSCGYDMDGVLVVTGEAVAREIGVPPDHAYCGRCNADLGDPGKLQWVTRSYPSARCDKCGLVVVVAHWNVNLLSGGPDFEMILCPSQHFVGVRVRGDSTKLLSLEECCLTPGVADGVHAESEAESSALRAMLAMAKREDLGFLSFFSDSSSRRLVCCEHGETVGYLAYTEHVPPSFPDPTIHQIYVRPTFRDRGAGTQLVGAFLQLYPRGRICIETPIQDRRLYRILQRFGLVTLLEEGKVKSTGRLYFRGSL